MRKTKLPPGRWSFPNDTRLSPIDIVDGKGRDIMTIVIGDEEGYVQLSPRVLAALALVDGEEKRQEGGRDEGA